MSITHVDNNQGSDLMSLKYAQTCAVMYVLKDIIIIIKYYTDIDLTLSSD